MKPITTYLYYGEIKAYDDHLVIRIPPGDFGCALIGGLFYIGLMIVLAVSSFTLLHSDPGTYTYQGSPVPPGGPPGHNIILNSQGVPELDPAPVKPGQVPEYTLNDPEASQAYDQQKPVYAVLFFFSIGMTLLVGYALLWKCLGVETITVHPSFLVIEKKLLGAVTAENFSVAAVRGVRVTTVVSRSRHGTRITHAVAFNHGGRMVRVGAGLDEMECRTIVKAMTAMMPEIDR